MNTRIIPCQVNNEYVKGSDVPVGAAGSHNDVVLEIAFSSLWDGLAKKITWLDANGGNPTLTILTTNMLKPGETNIYLIPIPAEPKAYAGDLTMTIKGLSVDGATETRATLTTSCTFKVLPSDYDNDADESADVTPTQAAQLQAEIDTIISTIVNAAASEDAAAGSAASAATSAANAASSETAAETAAATALSSAATASAAATAAGNAKDAAAASAAAAELAKESASTSASTATSAATTATSAATAAEESAATSATSETAAEVAAVTASGAAANAATARDAALVSETSAEGSKTAAAGSAVLSESWAVGGTDTRPGEDTNNAKYWSDAAQAAAGGGVTSFNSRSGAVAPQSGDYDATMVGADASGTAASAVSTHNGSDGAHASLFAGKSDTSHTHDTRYYTETETDTKLASKADDTAVVHDTGNETIGGVKTFSSFPVTPSNVPTDNYQAANKKYIDDKVKTDVPVGAKFTDTVYSHPASHPASMITGLPTSLPASGGNADTVNGKTVGTNVPADAVFTDTVYSHPPTHSISEVSGLQTTLDGKVDDSQVLTNVPTGAKFTDTVYSHPATHGADMITDGTTNKAYTAAEKTKLSGIDTNANNYSHPTSDGSKHVPANGTANNGKVLKAGATAGTYVWSNDNDTITTINGKTGAIAKADIVALGIPAQDTVYTHPANHPPSIITQDASNRFVTDTEKSTWNGKAESSHTHTKSQITDFPTSMTPTAHNQAGTTITVADSGGYFTGTNAETVLQEIGSTLNGLEAAITAITG